MANPALTPAVSQALNRRGMGANAGALDQTSTAQQPMNPSQMTQGSAPQGTPVPSAPKFEPANESEFIVSALSERLKEIGKSDKEKMKMASAPQMGGGMKGY